ncbi:MAG TPA: hypothetical protein VJV23_00505 [Candidatus Polarisedimenticolia bacterium]|nr:hypothetical protein [Candidatus Polarisedimenticolia bacterium]
MPSQQPDFWKPALLSGGLFGFLSAVPLLGALNCLCCSLVVGGGVLSAFLMVRASAVPLTYGHAALGGAVTGGIAAVVWGFFSMAFSFALKRDLAGEIERASEQFSGMGPEMSEVARVLAGIAAPVLFALLAAAAVVIWMPFGLAGGVLGRALFEKRTPAPPDQASGPASGLDRMGG